MCGIVGIVYPETAIDAVSAESIIQMRDALVHRGPDDAGVFIDRTVGLGHRRLAIVDVKRGHQPMSTPDGRFTITYNGEVFNHQEIREKLSALGYEFQTTSDTETILFAFQEFGPDCVRYFRGMFAFAIWDSQERILFLARDRFGIKPLFYLVKDDGSFYFASEIKSFFAADIIKTEMDPVALWERVHGFGVPGEGTLFKSIRKLLPGHSLTWHDGQVSTSRYWHLDFKSHETTFDDSRIIEEWKNLFDLSVKLRLMSDVPLGVFLSGGIDSSAICAAMAQIVGPGIKTFSVGFRGSADNELEYARIVSEQFDTEHHELLIDANDCLEFLPRLVSHFDEPIGFEASLPLYAIAKLASQNVKVVLTGEGSDEMLGGYSRYRHARRLLSLGQIYQSAVPNGIRAELRKRAGLLPGRLGQIADRSFLTRQATFHDLYIDNFAVFPRNLRDHLFSEEWREQLHSLNIQLESSSEAGDVGVNGILNSMLAYDSMTYLRDLLDKQDRMSMAASVESRVPFLDHHLAEFSAGLPDRFKIRGSIPKWILRESMKNVLPERILNRKKVGFPVPFGNWFRNEWKSVIDEFLLSPRARGRGIFNEKTVADLVLRHTKGENHTMRIWFLLNFEIWQRIYFDRDPDALTQRAF